MGKFQCQIQMEGLRRGTLCFLRLECKQGLQWRLVEFEWSDSQRTVGLFCRIVKCFSAHGFGGCFVTSKSDWSHSRAAFTCRFLRIQISSGRRRGALVRTREMQMKNTALMERRETPTLQATEQNSKPSFRDLLHMRQLFLLLFRAGLFFGRSLTNMTGAALIV